MNGINKNYLSLIIAAKNKMVWATPVGLTILVGLVVLTMTGAKLPQTSGGDLVYSEDFESGDPVGWQLESGWQVVEVEGGHALSGLGHVWANANVGTWDDSRFRFKVKLDGGSLHANYRLLHSPEFRRYFLGLNDNGLYLSKQVGSTFYENLATAPGLSNGWHTVEVVGTGPAITISIDAQPVMSYTDLAPLLNGSIAFESLNDSPVLIDDVEVWATDSTPTPSGPTWVRTGGPLGGLGYDVRMRPDNPDIMYVTDAWAGVHKSIDGGQTWVSANEGIDARTGPSNDAIPVFCLTIDPNNYDIIWIGLQNTTGIYRSSDGGLSWEKRINGIVEDSGLTIRGITVEPGNSNVVYAAGEISSWYWAGQPMLGKEFDKAKGVVYKSTDAGLTWGVIWRGDSLARYVLIDPNNVNTLYVSTGIFDREAANTDPNTNTPGGIGILKSTNGGQTLVQINNGLDSLYVGSLFMHPQNSQILLAGAGNDAYPDEGGIFLTTNGGAQWQYKGGQTIESVEFATDNPNVAYAGGQGEFYRSDDRGQSWQPYMEDYVWGPEGIRAGFPIDFQVDLRDSMRIFANNYGGGNFLSEDGGQTWASASTGYTGAELTDVAIHLSNPAIVYANGRSGPFRSADGGATWQGINPIELRPIAEGARITVDPHNPNHILMSSGHWGWTYESMDQGTSWTLVTNYEDELRNLPGPGKTQGFQGMQAIVFAPSSPAKVYGGFGMDSCVKSADPNVCSVSTIVSILTSEDGGHTWTRREGSALDGLTVTEIVVHPTNAGIAWAATVGGGVFRTADGGTTWETASNGLGDTMVMDLAGNPNTPDVLYAGTLSNGVFKSENGGTSWQASSAGMDPNEPIGALVVDPIRPEVVYAGSWMSGVYLSEDAGATWRLINNGLRTRSVRALTISSDGQILYAGTKGEGVFRLGELSPGVYLPVILKN